MERRQLEYFLAVVDHGGMTAAATALHVTQPSLSQAIRLLERELGGRLFHRLPRGVELTSAGRALLEPARRVVRDLSVARSAVRDVLGMDAGSLDIAIQPALTLHPFAPALAAFRHRFPNVLVTIMQPEEPSSVCELVGSGRAEIGFLDRHGESPVELDAEHLQSQQLMAVLPPGTAVPEHEPVPIPELMRRGLIAGGTGTWVRDLVERWAREHGEPVQVAIEVGRRETGVHLVVAGAGVSIFPEPLARIAEALGAVVRPLEPSSPRRIAMYTRPAPLSPAAEMFRGLVRAHRDREDPG